MICLELFLFSAWTSEQITERTRALLMQPYFSCWTEKGFVSCNKLVICAKKSVFISIFCFQFFCSSWHLFISSYLLYSLVKCHSQLGGRDFLVSCTVSALTWRSVPQTSLTSHTVWPDDAHLECCEDLIRNIYLEMKWASEAASHYPGEWSKIGTSILLGIRILDNVHCMKKVPDNKIRLLVESVT